MKEFGCYCWNNGRKKNYICKNIRYNILYFLGVCGCLFCWNTHTLTPGKGNNNDNNNRMFTYDVSPMLLA